MIVRSIWQMMIVVLAVAYSTPGQAETPQPLTAEPSLQELIDQLSSEDYRLRQQATRKLMYGGEEVAEPLRAAASKGNPEVASRALAILDYLHHSENPATIDAADFALQDLADLEKSSLSERAELILHENYPITEERAIAEIQRLGGQIKPIDDQIRNQLRSRLMKRPSDEDLELMSVGWVILGRNWKGGEEGIKHLKRLRFLPTAFVVKGCPISEETLRDLNTELPYLELQQRGPAFLGVSMQSVANGCQIADITPGSAADKSGLQRGDIITTFNGEPALDTETLIDMIGEHLPGEKIPVELIRNFEKKTIEVELGGWDAALSEPNRKPTPIAVPQPVVP